MVGVEESSPYREWLFDMIAAIDKFSIPLTPQNQVLIVISLDTEEKIGTWMEWIRARLTGENDLDATEAEIVRAAVRIGKGLM